MEGQTLGYREAPTLMEYHLVSETNNEIKNRQDIFRCAMKTTKEVDVIQSGEREGEGGVFFFN